LESTEVAWPAAVGGYACRAVTADLPQLGAVAALIVDEAADVPEEDEIPDWVPAEWLSPVVGDSNVSDIYGAIGVWPAAYVAAEALMQHCPQGAGNWTCVEVGCGAGFPSLVAARLGAQVIGLDSEQLPLDLLRAAFDSQAKSGCFPEKASLQTLTCDATKAEGAFGDDGPLVSADIVVVSDLLYSVELGEVVGKRLGRWARSAGPGRLVLTDGGRSGRTCFLEAFSETYGSKAHFEDVPVPAWAAQRDDFFDGERTTSVGLLRY